MATDKQEEGDALNCLKLHQGCTTVVAMHTCYMCLPHRVLNLQLQMMNLNNWPCIGDHCRSL